MDIEAVRPVETAQQDHTAVRLAIAVAVALQQRDLALPRLADEEITCGGEAHEAGVRKIARPRPDGEAVGCLEALLQDVGRGHRHAASPDEVPQRGIDRIPLGKQAACGGERQHKHSASGDRAGTMHAGAA
jgi:hypothetical protein